MNKMKYLLAIFLLGAAAQAGTLRGRIIRVADGDSLTLLTSANRQVEIRVAGIDAPERNQEYGRESRQALSAACYRRNAVVLTQGKDIYGRTLGQAVYCDGRHINATQVASGFAWVYRHRHAREDRTLVALEQEARLHQRGLWRDPAPLPPWEYRRRHPRSHAPVLFSRKKRRF